MSALNFKLTGRKFVATSVALTFSLFIAYFLMIHILITIESKPVPTSFKELLLTKTDGPKIIIDSGSNSQYAIDPLIIEHELKMPAINLADSIYHPLQHKYQYLSRHTSSGDIVVLPLEWVNYSHKPQFTAYATKILNRQLRYYYQSLPMFEKLEFITQYIGVYTLVRALPQRLAQIFDPDFHKNNLQSYKKRLSLHNGNSLGSLLAPNAAFSEEQLFYNSPCNEKYFGNFRIGEQFIQGLDVLQEVSNKGVVVAFTWPAIVDRKKDGCFQSEDFRAKLRNYSKKIVGLLQQKGFLVIGELEDSVFPEEYIFDMFYHILEPAAKERTIRLVKRMKEAGISTTRSDYRPGDSITHLRSVVENLMHEL